MRRTLMSTQKMLLSFRLLFWHFINATTNPWADTSVHLQLGVALPNLLLNTYNMFAIEIVVQT